MKKLTLAYYVDNLTKKSSETVVEKDKEFKKALHVLRMEEEEIEGFKIVSNDFEDAINLCLNFARI